VRAPLQCSLLGSRRTSQKQVLTADEYHKMMEVSKDGKEKEAAKLKEKRNQERKAKSERGSRRRQKMNNREPKKKGTIPRQRSTVVVAMFEPLISFFGTLLLFFLALSCFCMVHSVLTSCLCWYGAVNYILVILVSMYLILPFAKVADFSLNSTGRGWRDY